MPAPDLPNQSQWLEYGIEDPIELRGGKQSRVFAATRVGRDGHCRRDVAVKLTDRRFADASTLATRMQVVEALANDLELVVPPVRLAGRLVQVAGGWLMTATVLVRGQHPDVGNPVDGRLMGLTLAQVHRSLALLPEHDLAPVAALQAISHEPSPSTSHGTSPFGWQLVHGDFSDQNLLNPPSGLRLVDFDECGYGPIEYDLGNSLYMVLFDAEITQRPERYEMFRQAFLDGYRHGAEPPSVAVVDQMIALRIRALSRWLDDLATAPIGIRTSSADWRKTLRSFVRSKWYLVEEQC